MQDEDRNMNDEGMMENNDAGRMGGETNDITDEDVKRDLDDENMDEDTGKMGGETVTEREVHETYTDTDDRNMPEDEDSAV